MSSLSTKLPRVNLVSVVSGVVALVSLTLPWWGVNGLGLTLQWGLFTQPSQSSFFDSAAFDKALGLYSLAVVAFALVSVAAEMLGSFDRKEMFLAGGLAGSVLTLISYPIVVAAALTSAEAGSSCHTSGSCVTGAFGSSSGVTWGFQTGYYLFIASAVLLAGAIMVHKLFVQSRGQLAVPGRRVSFTPSELAGAIRENNLGPSPVATSSSVAGRKFCINCGGPLPSVAKFRPNCAYSTQTGN